MSQFGFRESIWIDSQYWVNLDSESQFELTLNIKSIWIPRINLNWLSIMSQFGFRESIWILNLNIESIWIPRINLNWLSILSQFDSNILQLLGIAGRILVPPWLNFLGQNDSFFFFQGKWKGFWQHANLKTATHRDKIVTNTTS